MTTLCVSNKLLHKQMGNIVFQGLSKVALHTKCLLTMVDLSVIHYDPALDNEQISLKGECPWDTKSSHILMTQKDDEQWGIMHQEHVIWTRWEKLSNSLEITRVFPAVVTVWQWNPWRVNFKNGWAGKDLLN